MNSDELEKIIEKLKLIKEFTNSTEYKIIPKDINYNKDSNLNERFSAYFNRFENTIVDYYEKTKLINSIKDNYLFILDRDLDNIMIYINELDKAIKIGTMGFDLQIKQFVDNVENYLIKFEFNFDVFKKLNFLDNNIVIVGANGSGKSSFAMNLKDYMREHCVIITAQKILKLGHMITIRNEKDLELNLNNIRNSDRSCKDLNVYKYITNEFGVLIEYLINKEIKHLKIFTNKMREYQKNKYEAEFPDKSDLEKTIDLWNEIIFHREIFCEDGININLRYKNDDEKLTEYNSNEMSDGEKVILFYIAQVINAPEKGFIIIDEPEMFLHKAILIKLWDKLELLREDCMFLYLTHNVEFAVSRHNAKKIWMKSYKHPQNWSFEEVTKNKIPEKLVLELLGTRTVILFCESKNKNGLDEQIYNVLYPKFRVVSVSGCKNVINYTKSYNSLENKIEKAIGIIDKDFNENSTNRNEIYENIFVLNFAEIENIFFLENVLLHFAKLPNYKKDNINILKSKIISKYERDLEIQILKYVEFRINKHFKNGFLKKSKKLDDVKSKYDEFHEKVKIEEWYKERKIFIEELITRNDYDTILKFYNNKGLVQYANEFFNINNYQEQVINLLKSKDEKLISIILGAMPEKLNEIHNKIKVFSA